MDDVKITFTKQDKALLDNLIKVIARAKLELEGVEVLFAADSMRWLSKLQKYVEEEAKKPSMGVPLSEPIKSLKGKSK